MRKLVPSSTIWRGALAFGLGVMIAGGFAGAFALQTHQLRHARASAEQLTRERDRAQRDHDQVVRVAARAQAELRELRDELDRTSRRLVDLEADLTRETHRAPTATEEQLRRALEREHARYRRLEAAIGPIVHGY